MVKKEHHLLSDYTYPVSGMSRIVPGKKITSEWRMRCPSCGYDQPEPEHGIETVCPKCGLHMQAWGNMLDLWMPDEAE